MEKQDKQLGKEHTAAAATPTPLTQCIQQPEAIGPVGCVAESTRDGGELFGANCEIGAALTLVRSMGYHEGFENGRVIKSICEGPNANDKPAV